MQVHAITIMQGVPLTLPNQRFNTPGGKIRSPSAGSGEGICSSFVVITLKYFYANKRRPIVQIKIEKIAILSYYT